MNTRVQVIHMSVCVQTRLTLGGPGQAPTQLGTLVSHTEAAALAWTGSVFLSELAFVKINPCFHSCF